MTKAIVICPHVSWTIMDDTVYIVDERDESIIVIEDSGVALWEHIVERVDRSTIIGLMVRDGHEAEDEAIINDSLNCLISIGLIEEKTNE